MFNGAERNYDVHDRELLAFVHAIQHWEHYLLSIPFEWHTDHRNLTYFMEKQDLTSRQHRWSQVMSQYNYTPHHREGKKMYLTDPMSRQIQHKVGEADDEQNKQILVIDPDRIRYMSTQTVLLKEEDLLDRIRKCDKIDDSLKSAVETVRKNEVIAGKHGLADWAVENGILHYKGYIYVPNDTQLRRDIVARYHDALTAGHPGENKTIELVSRNYWWPRMGQFVRDYVSTCDVCGRVKNRPMIQAPVVRSAIEVVNYYSVCL